MVISLPVPEALQKETAEKTLEIRLPVVTEILKENKLFVAFKTVLQSPLE